MTQQAFLRTATPAFVVIAEFVVKEGMLEVFLAHAFDDAQNSLAKEPGCLQFDVLRTPDHPNGVLFYEVYQSRQAFDEHLKTPHVDKFRALLSEDVHAEQPVRTLERFSCVPT